LGTFTGELGAEGREMFGAEAGGDAALADAALLQNRYVDQTGKPIADVTAGTGVEYRRLPVQMVLAMDQRWLPRVLVECANAALPIEVSRVRINPEKSGAGFEGVMSAGGPEGGRLSSMNFSSPYGGGGSLPDGLSRDYAKVEIQGLVYIFNPPDPAVLTVPGLEEPAAEPGAEPAAEPAAPAPEVAALQP
jgi:hypothetical protein